MGEARIGRYELRRVLGEGGAGRVCEGVLRGPGGVVRSVAVKVLHDGAEELRREARIGGLLRHQNLVDVYEVNEEDGRWFCAMELCLGGSLRDHIPLSPKAVVEAGLQVCAALQYAHEELGLIHLDIKPDNLLLKDGVVKVADLGIARARGFGRDARIRGTPGYMAPEQARGEALDARADLYALGVTLLVLATGALPRADETLDGWGSIDPSSAAAGTLDLEASGGPETWAFDEPAAGAPGPDSMDTFDPGFDTGSQTIPQPAASTRALAGVPDWLAPAIEGCLAERPADRWEDMEELAEVLRGLQVDGPGLKAAVGWTPPPTKPQREGTNLGEEPNALVGREAELAILADALEAPCLLSVKGPAGVGKTRLAAAAARRWRQRTGGQAWLCDLSNAHTAPELLFSLANTLGVLLGPGDTGAQVVQIGHALASRGPAILVLDNFEQLSEFADVAAHLRAAAPEARVVATSREPLHLDGEQIIALGTLSTAASEALLVARARLRGAEIAGNPDLPELAARLDGLPLALELAAGRLGVLSVPDVLERLNLSLLRQGTGDRHDTLQAALDWSWQLLEPAERSALAQLSVFASGFTLEDAEEVLEVAGTTALDAVTALAERSMVQVSEDGRLGLLVSVCDFASRKLADRGAAERRHGACYARRGHPEALAALRTHGGLARRAALALALDNLTAASRRAAARGAAAAAAAAAMAAWSVLELQGPFALAADLLRAVLKLPSLDAAARVRVSCGLGQVLKYLGEKGEEQSQLSAALALARELGDPGLEGRALRCLASSVHNDGDADTARTHYQAALALLRQSGDRSGEATALRGLGLLNTSQSRYDEARASYEAALALAREVGDRREEGGLLRALSALHSNQGRPEEGVALSEEALEVHREVGDRQGEAWTLAGMGTSYQHLGQLDRARDSYRDALAVHSTQGDRYHESVLLGYLGSVLAQLGEHAEARECLERSVAVCQEIGNRRGECAALLILGSLELTESRRDEARACYEASLTITRAIGEHRREVFLLSNLGILHAEEARFEEARASFAQALALARETANNKGECLALHFLGNVHRQMGDLDAAFAFYQEALALCRAIQYRRMEGELLCELGALLRQRGQLDEARPCLDEALAVMREVGYQRGEIQTLMELGTYCREQGLLSEALSHLEAAQILSRKSGVWESRVQLMLAQILAAMGDCRGALARLADAEASAPEAQPEDSLAELRALRAELTGA